MPAVRSFLFILLPPATCVWIYVVEGNLEGINQTVYRVQLRVSAVTQAMLGHTDVQTKVETVILLEERLIAGRVPQVVLSGREEASQRL